jgi:hypothetical protein
MKMDDYGSSVYLGRIINRAVALQSRRHAWALLDNGARITEKLEEKTDFFDCHKEAMTALCNGRTDARDARTSVAAEHNGGAGDAPHLYAMKII